MISACIYPIYRVFVLTGERFRQLAHQDDGIVKYLHEVLEKRKSGKADERELARKCCDETMVANVALSAVSKMILLFT